VRWPLLTSSHLIFNPQSTSAAKHARILSQSTIIRWLRFD